MRIRGLILFSTTLVLMAGASVPALAQAPRLAQSAAPSARPVPVTLATTDTFAPQQAETSEPAFGPETLGRTQVALQRYEEIVAQGGWQKLPPSVRGFRQGQQDPLVVALRNRLMISGDLDRADGMNEQFDAPLAEALRRFQARHGLSQTGSVGPLTLAALNVPASVRLKQLRATVERLQNNAFKFGPRYVVVNIPGAIVEAVANGRVERRHLAVVGRRERPSPVIAARISSVNLNPSWTVPNSIIRKDVVKELKKDPSYLHKHNLRTFNWKGEEIDPNSVTWTADRDPGFILRQDPGPQNSLGQLKIDMPNTEAVYLHDTPKKDLFRRDVRFHSSGCARVSDIRDLAVWLLAEQGVDRSEIDRDIEAGLRTEIKLKRAVPVAWVYLTGYADGAGHIQFREDIYGLDTPEGIALTTLDGKRKTRPKSDAPQLVASRARIPVSGQPTSRTPQMSGDPMTTGSVKSRQTVRPAGATLVESGMQPLPERTVQRPVR